MQKKKLILLVTGLLLLSFMVTAVEAKKKTKWQKMLERNGISLTFWRKYLPKVTHKEYKKAVKKYKTASFKPSTGVHKNITTTYFWAGEGPSKDNGGISNYESCWDGDWDDRISSENPFYFALPYNDFNSKGKRKSTAAKFIPWANEKSWGESEPMLKNRWIKITYNDKTAYAQWEDAGPFGEDDYNYVFGTAAPKNKKNSRAGLDVSPAVKEYLGLTGLDKTDWQFVDENEVTDGPWKKIITRSGISWN